MTRSRLFGPRVPAAVAEAHPLRFLAPSLLLATAAGFLVASIFLPYWTLELQAPQYPGGLHVTTFLNRVEGDVGEIDGLNHYIGMRPLAEAAQFERSVSLIAVTTIAFLVLAAVFLHNRLAGFLALPAILFPVVFLADLGYWLRNFGTNLDPTAPLSSSIKPFVPPVLGTGHVGQFATVARPASGLILAAVASLVILAGLYLHRRAYKPLVEAEKRGAKAKAALAIAVCVVTIGGPASAKVWTVEDGADYSLAEAVQEASAGDVIEIRGGVHEGGLVIDRPLVLRGHGWPMVDGGGQGTVLSIEAPDVEISGLAIRGSGGSLDEENAGISVEAPRVRIDGNRFEDVLFGIYLREASGSSVEGNVISGKDLAVPRRGDAIRIWQSRGVTVRNNKIQFARDVVLWYSSDLLVEDNHVSDGRYGLHFMYCDDAVIRGNLLWNNSVGAFLMYSRRLRLEQNTLAANHGPSGYGVGLKDMDDARVTGNLFLGNRVGVFLDNSPREVRSTALVRGNRFVGNDAGVKMLPNVRRAEFIANSFEENQEQVEIAGGGSAVAENRWQGNFWSDYLGFDVDRDGLGDVPYRSQRLFESFADRAPELEVFSLGLAARFLDFAARVLPSVRPQPKLTDPEPKVRPIVLAGVPSVPVADAGRWLPWSFLLILAGAIAAGFASRRKLDPSPSEEGLVKRDSPRAVPSPMAVGLEGVTKRYGERAALDRLSIQIEQGESIALWGANGAGKTTLFRVILGLARFEGKVEVLGSDPKADGIAVRRRIGYVPQRFGFLPGISVGETLWWFARLRQVGAVEVDRWVKELALEDRLDDGVETLSGGWQQRVALAIALLGDPPVLLLDEPSANLDRPARRFLLESIESLRSRGKTILFATHRASEVTALADRVLHLEAGREIAFGSPAEVLGALRVRLRLLPEPGSRAKLEGYVRKLGEEVEEQGPWISLTLPQADKARVLARLFAEGIRLADFDFGPARSLPDA